MTQRFAVKASLPVQRLGAEMMVFDTVRDEVHVLNETSAAIWEGVREGLGFEKIAQRLAERYDLGGIADPPGLVLAALEELAEKGILVREEPGAGGAGEK